MTAIRDRIKELRRVRAGDLAPNPKNWRRHPAKQEAAMRGVLAELGYADALLARETPEGLMLIDGHLRASLDPEQTVPVLVLDVDQAEADYLLATLDPLSAMAERDAEAIADLLGDVRTGEDAVRDLLESVGGPMSAEGFTDPDEAPPLPPSATAQRGQVWICGEHRLMCGDAMDSGDVSRLMAGETPLLMVTDPPYGVNYDPAWRVRRGVSATDYMPLEGDNTADWRRAFAHFNGAVAYVWAPSLHIVPAVQGLESAAFVLRSTIIWVKQHFALSQGHYNWQHENCLYAVRSGETARWCGGQAETTIWEAANLNAFGRSSKEDDRTPHATQKPLSLMERPMRNHTIKAVYDPFLGSGTTMIAAERSGRRCYAMEIEPRYVDVAVRRWEEFTGLKAVIE